MFYCSSCCLFHIPRLRERERERESEREYTHSKLCSEMDVIYVQSCLSFTQTILTTSAPPLLSSRCSLINPHFSFPPLPLTLYPPLPFLPLLSTPPLPLLQNAAQQKVVPAALRPLIAVILNVDHLLLNSDNSSTVCPPPPPPARDRWKT